MTHLKFSPCLKEFASIQVAYKTLRFNLIVEKLNLEEVPLEKQSKYP